jgi:integrase
VKTAQKSTAEAERLLDVRFIPSTPDAASQDRLTDSPSEPSTDLQKTGEAITIRSATPPFVGRRGPVPKRRYQEGTRRKENEHYYSFFYRDREMADGSVKSVFTRFDLGRAEDISELSARREHDRLRNEINRERGSVRPAPKGEKFKDIASAYMKNIAPHLSPSTVRQRTSHLRAHLLPRLGESSLMSIDSLTLQCFSTELLARLSRKTIINVLGTLFAVMAHAKQSGIRVSDVSLGSIKLGGNRDATEAKYFKHNDAHRIIQEAREPYRTIFALAWATGLRAGELLGLRVVDLDFDRKLIQPRTQADDRTRESRQLKTSKSTDTIPMTDETITMLADYLKNQWKANPQGLLFPNRRDRPCKRANVVKFGLWPILKRMDHPTHRYGLHAFRHGLGTALADSRVSPKVVQSILRHTDIKTTLRYYVHVDDDVQRDALAQVQSLQKT